MCKLGSNTGLFSAVFFSCFNLSRLKILCSTTGVSRNNVRFSPSVPVPVSTRRNPRRLVRDKHFGFLQSLKMLGGHLWSLIILRRHKIIYYAVRRKFISELKLGYFVLIFDLSNTFFGKFFQIQIIVTVESLIFLI